MKHITSIFIMLSMICLFIVQCTGSGSLPADIAGKWTTTDEKFKGEYIDLSSSAVVFGTDDGSMHIYKVVEVKAEKGPIYRSTLYHIHCTDETGGENLFNIIYTPEEGGTLRHKSSQDVLWKKA